MVYVPGVHVSRVCSMTNRNTGRKRRSRHYRKRRRDEEEQESDGNETTIEYTTGSDSDDEHVPVPRRKRWCCFHSGCARELLELVLACAALLWVANNYAEKNHWFDTSPPGPPPIQVHSVDTSVPWRETGHLLSHFNLHSGRNRSFGTASSG